MPGMNLNVPKNQQSKGGKKGGKKPAKKKGKRGNKPLMSLGELFNMGVQLGHPRQQAKQDMSLIYGPQIRGLKGDYRDYANQMGALYTILGNQLEKTGKGAQKDYTQAAGAFSGGVQDILGSLAQDSTAPDQKAFMRVLGAQTAAGSNDLAQQAMNEQRYNASMGTQADLENMILQRNARGDLNQGLQDIRTQRATDLRNRVDELRQMAFDRMMALREYQLRAAAVGSQLKGDKASRQFWMNFPYNTPRGGGGGGGGGRPTGGHKPKKNPQPAPHTQGGRGGRK